MNLFEAIFPNPHSVRNYAARIVEDLDRGEELHFELFVSTLVGPVYEHHYRHGGKSKRAENRLVRATMRVGNIDDDAATRAAAEIRLRNAATNAIDRSLGHPITKPRRLGWRLTPVIALFVAMVGLSVYAAITGSAPQVLMTCGIAMVAATYCVVVLAWLDGYRRAAHAGGAESVRRARAELQTYVADRDAAETPCSMDLGPAKQTPGEGFLYVIKFSTGVVKVGRTEDPRRRFGAHRNDAGAYRVAIVDYWLSPAHLNFCDNEVRLINRCLEISADRARLEYFHNVDFAAVVNIARGLTYFTNDPSVAKGDSR